LIASLDKEIKAVTYHNLAVRQTRNGFEAHIVFDV
jgi:SHS2 domain-containing protein